MKEAKTTPGKLIPPAINKRPATKSPKQTTTREMDRSPPVKDASPPTKKRNPSKPSSLDSAASFEAVAAAASREVSVLLEKLGDVSSGRAAADRSQMKQLEVILTEARTLESNLKEKKNHLRQTLAVISDKLLR